MSHENLKMWLYIWIFHNKKERVSIHRLTSGTWTKNFLSSRVKKSKLFTRVLLHLLHVGSWFFQPIASWLSESLMFLSSFTGKVLAEFAVVTLYQFFWLFMSKLQDLQVSCVHKKKPRKISWEEPKKRRSWWFEDNFFSARTHREVWTVIVLQKY